MTVSFNANKLAISLNFKGKKAKTNQGNDYYKTNSGTIAGCVMAVPALLLHFANAGVGSLTEKVQENFQKSGATVAELENFENFLKSNYNIKNCKKYALPFGLLAAGLTVGCGVLIDNIRNKKAAETADYVNKVGLKNAFATNDKISISKKGKPYYDSNDGLKWGGILGAGCGIVASMMTKTYGNRGGNIIGSIIGFGLGGLMMGAITDHNTNKKAEKNA